MHEIPEKQCVTCKETKIVHEFHMSKRPGGFANQCKQCCKTKMPLKTIDIIRKNLKEKIGFNIWKSS